MGIKERQERDREAVRRSILDAARELFVREGYQNVSMRKIAERIEYSAASIYSYFPSKDDIFFALAEEGFRLLSDGQHCGMQRLQTLPPLERIRAIFWRLYQFSVEQPQYFALMFVDRSVPRISREYERFTFARDLRRQLLGHVEEGIKAGVFPAGTSPFLVFRLLTMAVLGVAAMRLSDRLGQDENPDDLASDILDVTIAGLQSSTVLRSKNIRCALDFESSTPRDETP